MSRVKLVTALAALSISAFAQIDPHPKELHRVATGTPISEFALASVDFQELRPGTREIARIKLNNQAAIRTVKFESVDQGGKAISLLPAIKAGHDPADGEYLALLEVPKQSFRIRASGLDLTGMPYERVFKKLFQPVVGKRLEDPLEADFFKQFEAEKQAHPDGVIAVSPIDVFSAGYEPFLSNANISGIRVWYSVRFAADGVYSLSPRVFPIYEDVDSRGLVAMKVLREKLDPVPEAPQGVQVLNLLQAGGTARYKGGTEYRVVLDLIPDYIVANSLQNKFCIYEAKFPAQGKGHDAWNLVKSDPTPVQYRVEIPELSFAAETEIFHPQRTFYEAFLKQGAFDCGPTPNAKF